MKFSISFQTLSGLALISSVLAAPTWPSSTDELEALMLQTTGYRSRQFADLVTPCSKSPNMPGRINAAEWMRTCFHDMATHNRYQGTGGLDGSLMFETGRSENTGPAFQTTFIFLQQHLSVKTSIADLLALSMYASVRGCDGPVVPMRGGRIDAEVAGENGVPQPENPTGTFVAQFDRMGLNVQEMIDATACGHTIGGVHSAQHPLIVPVGTAPNEYKLLDDPTQAASKFDERIAADFVLGNTTNPLVGGSALRYKRDSDFRVYTFDGNVTIRQLADPNTFRARCAVSMAKLIDTVPASVQLSDVIVPYDIKPINPQLTLLPGGTQLSFAGEIRVRTTTSGAGSVAVVYKSRSGGVGGTILTTIAGTGSGFDDSFTFFAFSGTISAASGISSFVVTADGETQDNNGAGFPMQDTVFYQNPQSCLDPNTDDANMRKMTVTAVKLTDVQGEPVLDFAQRVPRTDGVVVPRIVRQSLPMSEGQTVGLYTLYSVSTPVGSTQALKNSFDVLLGDVKDEFKLTGGMGSSCAALPGDGGSSSSPSSSESPTSTTGQLTSTSEPPISSTEDPTSTNENPTTTDEPPSSTSNPPAATTDWVGLGCYTDSVASRTLPIGMNVPASQGGSTNAKCQSTCLAAGYKFAGTEYSYECFCGNTLDSSKEAESGCSMPCDGDVDEVCGGPDRLNVWEWLGTGEPVPETSSTSEAPGPTSTAPPGWQELGCWTDSVGARALPHYGNVDPVARGMTNGDCMEACDLAGYRYAGTEYAAECFCGNEIGNDHEKAESGCSMKCAGANGEFCGGPNRLTLWKRGPAPKSAVDDYTYVGCHTDAVASRSLTSRYTGTEEMTLETCAEFCEGFEYFGTEYGKECFCGNTLAATSNEAEGGDCKMACAGDEKEACGAGDRLSVYKLA